ncbi:MAG: MoaD/ThiS family protein [Capsulimonadaceae bacterium]|nr:MoaD/ThiS family protein [Capsulimonadaceae bacterium]
MAKTSRIEIRVLLFAHLGDIMGTDIRLALPVDSRVSDAIAALALLDDRFRAAVKPARYSINGNWAEGVDRLRGGDELALIPPVSGG